MRSLASILPLALALCGGAAHAQLYKWVGPDGKVNYSDVPPPPTAAKVENKPVAAARNSSVPLPYELAQAARRHPVTLYTMTNCIPCDDGRKLLSERGIPFAEKTVESNKDIAAVRKVGSDGNLPLMTVGTTIQRGFEANAWNATLNAAGYPATNQLPKNWRNPLPESAARAHTPSATAAPVAASAPPAVAADETPQPTDLPPPAGNAPPGFRF